MIAPALRDPPSPLNERDAAAVIAYIHQVSRHPYPGFPPAMETAATVFARYCIGCHKLDGDGGTDGPDLTTAGASHDREALRRRIADPAAVDPEAEMPSFGRRLSAAELDAIADYLASRR
jgi:cytochrome c553